MKLTKKKNDASTLRKVWNDDKSKVYGVVGTVGDLLKCGILTYCDYSFDTWLFLSVAYGIKDKFGRTREEALLGIKEAQ